MYRGCVVNFPVVIEFFIVLTIYSTSDDKVINFLQPFKIISLISDQVEEVGGAKQISKKLHVHLQA